MILTPTPSVYSLQALRTRKGYLSEMPTVCKVLSMALQVARTDLSLLWATATPLFCPIQHTGVSLTTHAKLNLKKAWERLLNLKLPLWTKIICT